MDSELNVTVVCGGTSSEREVSLRSGTAVYNGLLEYGFKNTRIFDLKEGNLGDLFLRKPDMVYLALHGKGGEDGSIQGLLDLANIPYTGPGIAASAICMNKILTKRMLMATGIPTAKYIELKKEEFKDNSEVASYLISSIGIPMVLKSPCQGSSIGVYLVKDENSLPDAIRGVFELGNDLLAEEYLDGTEITLPIIGNEKLEVLPDIEITSETEFYDYEAKYTSGMCHHIIPARISEANRNKVREIGIKTYKVLGCCGVSRIDFIVDKVKGPMVIEVNTLPGMTETSLLPDSAKYAGISFGEICAKILEFGYEANRK